MTIKLWSGYELEINYHHMFIFGMIVPWYRYDVMYGGRRWHGAIAYWSFRIIPPKRAICRECRREL